MSLWGLAPFLEAASGVAESNCNCFRLATYQSKVSYTLKLVISFFTLKKSHNLQTHFIKDLNLLTDDISSSGKFFLSHFLISFQTPTFLLLIIRKKPRD